ncbi:MAG TPA: glycosyltransferase family 4 protein, partial [Chloroflexota bacterium]
RPASGVASHRTVRVALIGPVPPRFGGATPGGVATHQAYLAAGLAAIGVDAPLLATNTCEPAGAPRSDGDRTPFPLYRMPRPARAPRAYLSAVGYGHALAYALRIGLSPRRGSRREVLENLLAYRRFLASVNPDLVHVQHPLERCLYVRRVRDFERWTTPLVVTAHSLWGEHDDATIRELMAPNLRAADRVIAVSPHVAQQAVGLGVRPGRISVIRSGVDTDRFQPRERVAARQRLGLLPETGVVLFVGNLEPRKQLDVLLRATASVREQVPDVVLLVVGSGQSAGAQDQTARLRRLTSALGLDNVVRFMGRLDDARLLDAYAAADAFALTSTSEAQGIVALEAMACGLPVVATAVGGLLDTIEDGVTGFLVPSGAIDAVADRLVDLLRDGARRQTVGAAARRAVEERFSWPRAIDATLSVYREVFECRPPG